MKFRIIGYEGVRNGAAMTYGAAAVQMENERIMNAVTRFEPGITMDQAREIAKEDAAIELLPEPIEFEANEFPNGAFVFDLPTNLWIRQPYNMPKWEIKARLHELMVCEERTFLVFTSFNQVTRWLSSLHFKKEFSLQSTDAQKLVNGDTYRVINGELRRVVDGCPPILDHVGSMTERDMKF